MNANCPHLLLGRELDLLRPSYIVTFGRPPQAAVRSLEGFARSPDDAESVFQGALHRNEWSARVFSVAHPLAQRLWSSDREAMLRMLRAEQCAA
jgi:hypothetical protein